MVPVIDLACDLNAEDDEGRGWAVMANAREPKAVRPGVLLIAGTPHFWVTVRVIAVDDDGQSTSSNSTRPSQTATELGQVD